jgi:hypothetical protein
MEGAAAVDTQHELTRHQVVSELAMGGMCNTGKNKAIVAAAAVGRG